MKYQKFGTGDYQLMKEEHLRECTPCDLGYAQVKEVEGYIPAIVLSQPLKYKERMNFRDINTSWDVAQEHGNIELLFLNIDIKAAEGKDTTSIRIYIDKFGPEVMAWFQLLIATDGRVALNDSINGAQAIGITGIPLDVPKEILQQPNGLKETHHKL